MSKGEDAIARILTKSNIPFEREKTFHDLRHGTYRFDFYFPSYNGRQVVIEYNGAQHYQYVPNFYPSERWWRAALERDRRKISYCLSNDIDIYLIPYWDQPTLRRATDLFQEQYHAKSRWHNDEIRMKLPRK